MQLRKWVSQPLLNKDDVDARLDAVTEIMRNENAWIETVRKSALCQLPDLERGTMHGDRAWLRFKRCFSRYVAHSGSQSQAYRAREDTASLRQVRFHAALLLLVVWCGVVADSMVCLCTCRIAKVLPTPSVIESMHSSLLQEVRGCLPVNLSSCRRIVRMFSCFACSCSCSHRVVVQLFASIDQAAFRKVLQFFLKSLNLECALDFDVFCCHFESELNGVCFRVCVQGGAEGRQGQPVQRPHAVSRRAGVQTSHSGGGEANARPLDRHSVRCAAVDRVVFCCRLASDPF